MLRKIFLDRWAVTQILQGRKKAIVRPHTGRWATLEVGQSISLYCEHPDWERGRVQVCGLRVWHSLADFLALGLAEAAPGLPPEAAEEIYLRLYGADLAAGCRLVSISVVPLVHQTGPVRFFCERAGQIQISRRGIWQSLRHVHNQLETLAVLKQRLLARGWQQVHPEFFSCTSREEFGSRILDIEIQRIEAFALLTPAERAALIACLRSECFASGTVISSPAQPVDRVLVLRSGRVQVSESVVANGQRFPSRELGIGDSFNTGAESPTAELWLQALSEVRAFSLSRAEYQAFAMTRPAATPTR